MIKLFSNVKACKNCNGSGKVVAGFALFEGKYYKSCEKCDGQGHIVNGWKK